MTPGSIMELARGGQQSVQSCALLAGLQVCPIQPVEQVEHPSAITYEQTGGAAHGVVSGPSNVRGDVMIARLTLRRVDTFTSSGRIVGALLKFKWSLWKVR
jgi:hypothetical protein